MLEHKQFVLEHKLDRARTRFSARAQNVCAQAQKQTLTPLVYKAVDLRSLVIPNGEGSQSIARRKTDLAVRRFMAFPVCSHIGFFTICYVRIENGLCHIIYSFSG